MSMSLSAISGIIDDIWSCERRSGSSAHAYCCRTAATSSESESPGVIVLGAAGAAKDVFEGGKLGGSAHRFEFGDVLSGNDCRRFCEEGQLKEFRA